MRRSTMALLLLAPLLLGCPKKPPAPIPVPTPQPTPEPTPEPTPTPTPTPTEPRRIDEPIVVAAWAEPPRLPPGGGQAQILVRVQKRGGRPFPGVEVKLRTSAGSLFSAGKLLSTGENGMTRDRLTTRATATITLNAGGTRYKFDVPVEEPAEPGR